ncbi:MAG TPA: biosynthetic peptidoglycan transglycosylase, partial [Polyangiaceae bacterium]|nr:biosynthetic peptidoglycan transglycosylase [Polyangiaceae bacterium]
EVKLKQAELSLGDVRLRLAGTVSRDAEHTTVNVHAEVPQAACGALLAAVPHGMAPMLEALRVEGTLSLRSKVDFDSAHVDATGINLDVSNQCRITGVPLAISPNRFRDAWWREVKGPDGLPMTIQSGPGSPDWTAYEEISPYLETAILVCEDAGFFAHRGIDYRAIENSIRMNLEAGRFLRGGSTVTMQLAKNLYLSKEKTISRKFQEAVFTHLLEQELSKHELMELYLNVIEFGPGIYGVRQAARYYFNEEPRDLSLGQALYLASILPAPDTQHFAADGHVKDGWAGYLRKLMQIARKIRRISEEELQAGLAEQVAFRKPSERVGALGVAEDADDVPDDDERDDGPEAPAAAP